MAKKHGLKEILSNEAITKSVDGIWNAGSFNVPRYLFIANVLTDFLFSVLLSMMMLTGMCVKGKGLADKK